MQRLAGVVSSDLNGAVEGSNWASTHLECVGGVHFAMERWVCMVERDCVTVVVLVLVDRFSGDTGAMTRRSKLRPPQWEPQRRQVKRQAGAVRDVSVLVSDRD